MTDRKEISLGELNQRIEKQGVNVAMANVQVSGVAVIKDKDGNIKSEMKIISLEPQEPDSNGN